MKKLSCKEGQAAANELYDFISKRMLELCTIESMCTSEITVTIARAARNEAQAIKDKMESVFRLSV